MTNAPAARGSSRVGILISVLVLAALILFTLLHVGEARRFARLAERAEPLWLLAAVGFQIGTYVCAGGWFVESLATQVLVIFVIRTQGNPLRSRPSRPLVLTSLAVVATAMCLPFTPLASVLGFEPLPLVFFAILVPLVVTYLLAVECVKRWFYRRYTLA